MEGLTSIQSKFDPEETMERLEEEIRAQGMKVFARIDHATGAAEAASSYDRLSSSSSVTPVAARR